MGGAATAAHMLGRPTRSAQRSSSATPKPVAPGPRRELRRVTQPVPAMSRCAQRRPSANFSMNLAPATGDPPLAPNQSGAPREAGLADVAHYIFDGEDHGSVVPAAIMRGLRFAVPEPA